MDFRFLKYFNFGFFFLFIGVFLMFFSNVEPGCGCINYDKAGLDVIQYNGEYFYHFGDVRDDLKQFIIETSVKPNFVIRNHTISKINNSFLFLVWDRDLDRNYIIFENKFYGLDYSDVEELILYNGSFLYVGETKFNNYHIIFNDEILYKSKNDIFDVVKIKADLFWRSYEGYMRVLYKNGKLISSLEYDVFAPKEFNGELVYVAKDKNDNDFVIYNGTEYSNIEFFYSDWY